MITFKDVVETKKEMQNAIKLIDRTKNMESTTEYITKVNSKSAETINKLLGKYYRQPKKITLDSRIRNSNGYSSSKINIQMGKSGIGYTSWGSNMTPFNKLICLEKNQYHNGYIGEIITKPELYEKALLNLSDKGKEVLKLLKEAYEETLPIEGDSIERTFDIPISPEEKSVMNFGNKMATITFSDDRSIQIKISKNNNTNSRYDDNEFTIDELDINDREEFLKILFVENHAGELNKIIDDYLIETKEIRTKWENFEKAFNEKLAKYTMLDLLG
jgi:hypothetical protein